MILIKALLAAMAGVALCMANISGIVTDTGGIIPIPGAIVQLEKGGQTTTTGSDGSFTIIVSTAILSSNGKMLPNGLPVRISNNILSMTIAKRASVEVTTFDLTGKSLSKVRKSFDAGSYSITLPYRGDGIYLYKVKFGTMEFVLKGNSVNGVLSECAVSTQSSPSNTLSKQVMNTAAINDVIAATKTGYLKYRAVVTNSDTIGIHIKMIANAGDMTDTDGNVYQTVKIGNQVWMAENLRVTKYNDGSPIPLDTSTVLWSYATTPIVCFYNNTNNADSVKKYGALYNWYVVSPANLKKIAPAGWHVPTDSEWTIMMKYLVLNGYNWDGTKDTAQYNKIAMSLAAKTDWYTEPTVGEIGYNLTANNSTGFSALPAGYRLIFGPFGSKKGYCCWWSTTELNTYNAWTRYLYSGHDDFHRGNGDPKSCGLSVRLLKDN
jgi:uncharacterized protein (TIGR02145 family)